MIDPTIREHEFTANDRTVRGFAVLGGLVLGSLALRDLLARGAMLRGGLVGAVALLVTIAGIARPGTIRPIFVAAMIATTPVRWFVSGVLLGAMYYVVVTPIAVVCRLARRDALSRRRRRDAATYWVPKTMPADVKSYFRPS
jgi:uncharacterized membrane protein